MTVGLPWGRLALPPWAVAAGGTLIAAIAGVLSVKYSPSFVLTPFLLLGGAYLLLSRPALALPIAAAILVAVPYWMTIRFDQLSVPRAAIAVSCVALVALPKPRLRLVVVDLVVLGLALDIVISWYFQQSNGVPRSQLIDELSPLLLYPIARAAGTASRARVVSWMMLSAGAIGSLTVLYEYFVAHHRIFNFAGKSWAAEPGVYIFRPGGVFGSPPGAAVILSMCIIAALPLLGGRGWPARLAQLGVAICVAGEAVTFTRAGWLGLALGCAVYLLGSNGFGRGTLRIAAAVLAIGVVAAVVYPQAKHSETFQLGIQRKETFQDRNNEWRQSLPIAYDSASHLIIGRGIGVISFGTNLDPALASTQLPTRSAHNDYLRTLVEQGLLGVLLFIGLYASVVARALTHARFQPPGTRRLASAFAGVALCFAVGGTANDVFLFTPAVALMALAAGLCTTLTTQPREDAEAPAAAQPATTG